MAKGRSPVLTLRDTRVGRGLAALTATSLLLTSGAGLFTGVARAGDLPRVLVLPYAPLYDGLPRETGRKTAEVLETELRSSEQLQLVKLNEGAIAAAPKSVNPAPPRDAALIAEANERASQAEEHIRKLRFKPAADELEKVIALFERQHPYIDFNQLVDAYLGLAVANMRLGQDSEAEDLLAHVVRLAPDRKLDPEKFPPVFIRAHENVARRINAAPKAAVRIEPSTAGAAVFLDGREVGRSPVLLKDVVKGRHFVRIVPAGGEIWADRIDASPGDAVRIAPELGGGGPVADILATLSRNMIDELSVTRAVALGQASRADFVVVGGVFKEGESLVVASHLINVATRKVCLLQRVTFDHEMLSAGIEVYKVGVDVANKVEVFGDVEVLPAKVARDALPTGAPVPVAVEPVDVPKVVEQKPALPTIVRRSEEGTVAVGVTAPKTEVRRITATSGEPDLAGEPGAIDDEGSSKSKVWLWVLLGVAVVGGGAAGGYFYYDAATRPVTGSATMHW